MVTMNPYERSVEIINESKYVIAHTGAGISKESNVPTFRGEDGLWRNYDAMELATPSAFMRDPKLIWEWYAWRQGLIGDCNPNPAHETLVKLEKEGKPVVVKMPEVKEVKPWEHIKFEVNRDSNNLMKSFDAKRIK